MVLEQVSGWRLQTTAYPWSGELAYSVGTDWHPSSVVARMVEGLAEHSSVEANRWVAEVRMSGKDLAERVAG